MNIEYRADGMRVSGYVNAVERYSKVLYSNEGRFIEKVQAGTFKKALERSNNVELRFNHNPSRKLGETQDGTLKLREDSIGLYAEAVITDQEVINQAKEGNLTGWSFGFNVNDFYISEGVAFDRKTLTDIDLFEVSLLTTEPAYVGTSVQVL